MAAEEKLLKAFLYRRMYLSEPVKSVADQAERVVAGLFEAYRSDLSLLPPERQSPGPDPVQSTRAIGDFIAGMTDRYAIARYKELVGPVELPEGF